MAGSLEDELRELTKNMPPAPPGASREREETVPETTPEDELPEFEVTINTELTYYVRAEDGVRAMELSNKRTHADHSYLKTEVTQVEKTEDKKTEEE